jgi:hypothetical protein
MNEIEDEIASDLADNYDNAAMMLQNAISIGSNLYAGSLLVLEGKLGCWHKKVLGKSAPTVGRYIRLYKYRDAINAELNKGVPNKLPKSLGLVAVAKWAAVLAGEFKPRPSKAKAPKPHNASVMDSTDNAKTNDATEDALREENAELRATNQNLNLNVFTLKAEISDITAAKTAAKNALADLQKQFAQHQLTSSRSAKNTSSASNKRRAAA